MVKKILFIPLGVMLGAAAIGLAFPLLTGLPGAEQNIIPRFANKWHLGDGSENNPILQYLVKYHDMEFLAEIQFLDKTPHTQDIVVVIDDKKTGQHIEDKMQIGDAFVFTDISDDIKPYVHALDATVFSVRDTISEEKYLVVGAEWGTVFVGKFTPKLKLIEYHDMQFEFGILKTFTISYRINDIENKFWIADNVPLPVKAEYYSLDGTIDYAYELVKLES
ncbi:MAG: hypothetical protein HZA84_04525 [Thaumarchaeota archaeon]|nr:hypothetical protein [Nitrososphaerota archaeon]